MGPDDAPPALIAVLERARALGLLGDRALPDQIGHALGFAAAYEASRAPSPGQAGAAPPTGSVAAPAGSPQPRRWMDLGSGGGIPGLVLALRWSSAACVLLEASSRRARFLTEAVELLGIGDRVGVVALRAETAGADPSLRAGMDLVVARSFGPPPVTAECAAPFLEPPYGLLIVSEPPPSRAAEEEAGVSGPDRGAPAGRWPADGLAVIGLVRELDFRLDYGYQVLRQTRPCPDRFPRRPGMASKRPLWRTPPRRPHP